MKVICDGEKVTAVETNKGTIECDYFVNCGGFWARAIGQMSEPTVKVPLHACEHYYLHTELIPDLDDTTPAVRDLDGHIYFRENRGRLLCGGFEPEAKPAFEDGILPGKLKINITLLPLVLLYFINLIFLNLQILLQLDPYLKIGINSTFYWSRCFTESRV